MFICCPFPELSLLSVLPLAWSFSWLSWRDGREEKAEQGGSFLQPGSGSLTLVPVHTTLFLSTGQHLKPPSCFKISWSPSLPWLAPVCAQTHLMELLVGDAKQAQLFSAAEPTFHMVKPGSIVHCFKAGRRPGSERERRHN